MPEGEDVGFPILVEMLLAVAEEDGLMTAEVAQRWRRMAGRQQSVDQEASKVKAVKYAQSFDGWAGTRGSHRLMVEQETAGIDWEHGL